MSADYSDVEDADLINSVNKHILENKAGNTSSSNFTPNFILQFFNQVDVSNEVSLNNNKHEFANQIDVSNDMTLETNSTGLFQITDDVGAGAGVTQPARIGFCDLGA